MSLAHQLLRNFLYQQTGVALGSDKDYLIDSRLGAVMQEHGLRDLNDLLGQVNRAPHGAIASALISALTTHETSWFRDHRPFERLRNEVLPIVRGQGSRKLSIWSAACSSGQEIYSIAMLLRQEGICPPHWQVSLLASDLCKHSLHQAQLGIYNSFEIERGLPRQFQDLHFTRHGPDWQISEQMRHSIQFESINLINIPSRIGGFDIIFCRNVLIYFDRNTQQQVVQALHDRLVPGGFLFLGAAESPIGVCESLLVHGELSGLYRRMP